jgi:signal transduction histidine kinase
MFLVRDLVSPRTWLAMTSHLAGFILGLAVFVVVVTGLSLGFSLLVLALVGLPLLGLTLRLASWFAVAERARMGLMLGVRVPAWPAESRAGYRWGIVPRRRVLAERATWGEIGYSLLRLPLSVVAVTISIAFWSASLVLLTLPLYNKDLPSGGAKIGDVVFTGTATMATSAAIGLVLLLIAPQLTRGFGRLDAGLSRWLLGPPSDLAARVIELEDSRERVMDAAETERRRIERDLHDGAQQRLVALTVTLGLARLDAPPGPLADQLAKAHDEAGQALAELRELIHGIHPQVLVDYGLEAAVADAADRCAVPVDLELELPGRLPSAVEATAYFVVCEALANVDRHSGAARAGVRGEHRDGRLVLEVRDDGCGGADAGRGSGLTGLGDRLSVLDGRLSMSSPVGGPTVLRVDIPCGAEGERGD